MITSCYEVLIRQYYCPFDVADEVLIERGGTLEQTKGS